VRRVDRDDLAVDQPVEQVAERTQALLDGGRGERARRCFDPGRHMNRLNGRDRRHAGIGAPGQESIRGAGIGAARVRAAKNSRKRIDARSPATATSAGRVGEELIGTSWLMVCAL
jgi:hypothetical protein